MPFGIWTQAGSKNHVLDGVQIALANAQFLGKRTCPGMPDNTLVSSAKMAEPIEMLFGLWTWLGPRSHGFDVGLDSLKRSNNF